MEGPCPGEGNEEEGEEEDEGGREGGEGGKRGKLGEDVLTPKWKRVLLQDGKKQLEP